MYVLSSNIVLAAYSSGTHFTKHLKPKIFVSSKQIGTYKNLRLKLVKRALGLFLIYCFDNLFILFCRDLVNDVILFSL